jgi:hypothetical protein
MECAQTQMQDADGNARRIVRRPDDGARQTRQSGY